MLHLLVVEASIWSQEVELVLEDVLHEKGVHLRRIERVFLSIQVVTGRVGMIEIVEVVGDVLRVLTVLVFWKLWVGWVGRAIGLRLRL